MNCLRACAAAGVPVLVLDRPNPIGGDRVEGPLLDHDYRSFVGGASIPMRHGLTLGELARLLNAEEGIGADLHIVPLQGWSRELLLPQTGRGWIAPSPNLPRFEGVLLYPGQVLLEGTNLSEGRGTTTPFELVGAPYVDPERLAEAVAEFELPGVIARPVRFLPTFDKWHGQSCGGVFLHITDPAGVLPYRTSVAVLTAVARLWPHEFRLLPPPYEYETEKMPLDILSGGPTLRHALENRTVRDAEDLARLSATDLPSWESRGRPHQLYS